mmetsp:Transcript_27767/g.59712  ORF Transcript_27767/g.59712 Transcript_27767/m.59712 type:complete len:113 (-) Transcript_27767:122-460(-)
MARETALGSSYGLASLSFVIMSSMTAMSAAVGSRWFPSKPDLRGAEESSGWLERWRGVALSMAMVLHDGGCMDVGAKPKHVDREATKNMSLIVFYSGLVIMVGVDQESVGGL